MPVAVIVYAVERQGKIARGHSILPDMHRMKYYLIITMTMSLLWGIFAMLVGFVLRYGMGQLIENYLEGLVFMVDLKGTVKEDGVNICPVETSPGNDIYLGEWSMVIGSFVMTTGSFIIIYSLTGVVAGILHNDIILLLLLLVIGAVFCLEYFVFQLTASIYNQFHVNAQAELVDILQSMYKLKSKVNMFTATMNAIMLKTDCCGIKGPNDFRNLTFTDMEQTVNFVVSPACCKKSNFDSKPEVTFPLLKECAMTGHSHLINSLGCYPKLYIYIADNYGTLFVVGIMVLAVWQVIQVVFIIMILFKKPKVAKTVTAQDVERTMLDHVTKNKPIKFVPHWRVSTSANEDVQRIPSTEIW